MESRFSAVISLLLLGLTLPEVAGAVIAQNYRAFMGKTFSRKMPEIKIVNSDVIYNIIKDGGFEDTTKYSWNEINPDKGIIRVFDTEEVFKGNYSCFISCDPKPSYDWVGVSQTFHLDKIPDGFNIDNGLVWNCKLNSSNLAQVLISFRTLGDLSGPRLSYLWGVSFNETNLTKLISLGGTMPKQWTEYKKNMGNDWIKKALPEDAEINSIRIYACTNENEAEAVSFDEIELWAKLWNDVGVDSLLNSRDVLGSIAPVFRISSNGMNTQKNIRVEVEIIDKDNNKVYEDIKSIDSIPSQQYTDLQCKTWIPDASGEYTLEAKVGRKDDEIPENDSLRVQLNVTGIAETGQKPQTSDLIAVRSFLRKAIISYNVGSVKSLKIYDPTGRIVGSYTIQGRGSVEFSGNTGLYFVRCDTKTIKAILIE